MYDLFSSIGTWKYHSETSSKSYNWNRTGQLRENATHETVNENNIAGNQAMKVVVCLEVAQLTANNVLNLKTRNVSKSEHLV